MKSLRSLGWFAFAGVVGLAVDVAVLTLVRETVGVYLGRVLSFLAAATTTWLINRQLAFAGRKASVGWWSEYVRYLGLMLAGGIVNYLTYSVLAWKFSQAPQWLALYVAIGSLAGMGVNYAGVARFLYRHHQR